MIEIAPRMVAAFTLAGLVQAIVPQETDCALDGARVRIYWLMIGMTLGSITPGGPMTHFPVIASLYKVGVGVGPLVAYLSPGRFSACRALSCGRFLFSARN